MKTKLTLAEAYRALADGKTVVNRNGLAYRIDNGVQLKAFVENKWICNNMAELIFGDKKFSLLSEEEATKIAPTENTNTASTETTLSITEALTALLSGKILGRKEIPHTYRLHNNQFEERTTSSPWICISNLSIDDKWIIVEPHNPHAVGSFNWAIFECKCLGKNIMRKNSLKWWHKVFEDTTFTVADIQSTEWISK